MSCLRCSSPESGVDEADGSVAVDVAGKAAHPRARSEAAGENAIAATITSPIPGTRNGGIVVIGNALRRPARRLVAPGAGNLYLKSGYPEMTSSSTWLA